MGQITTRSQKWHVVHPNSSLDNEDAKVKKIADSLFDADCKEAYFVSQNGYPSGDPSTSWELTQLQKYCSSHGVSYEAGDSKAELVEKIEAA